MRAPTAGRAGFSLIEALVALTIASMTLMAIFELQIQMARSQQRAAEAIEQVAAQENALALTRQLNPMAEPHGRIELPEGDVIVWEAEPRTEPRINVGFPAGDGVYEVRLYRVTVGVERRQGRSPTPLTFDRMGWRRVDIEG